MSELDEIKSFQFPEPRGHRRRQQSWLPRWPRRSRMMVLYTLAAIVIGAFILSWWMAK